MSTVNSRDIGGPHRFILKQSFGSLKNDDGDGNENSTKKQ